MKINNATLVVLISGFAALTVGCGSSSSSLSSTTAAISSTGLGSTTISSNTATFVPVSTAQMEDYAEQSLSTPTNVQISVSLQDVSGTGIYGGTVQLTYVSNGVQHTGTFSAGTGINYYDPTLNNNGQYEAQFNSWFTSQVSGSAAFTGFFQDDYGSIVLVVDSVVSDGDAQGDALMSGYIYYKNFSMVAGQAEQSPYRECWFISAGPYNCQDSNIMNKVWPYPASGYQELGYFTGLSKSATGLAN